MMRGREIGIRLPAGTYVVTIRSIYRFIESSLNVSVNEGTSVNVTFDNSEKLWNVLFNVDLVIWIVKCFLQFGEPWDVIYEVAGNGFFVVWLLRIWIIRKRYFKIKISGCQVKNRSVESQSH